MTKIPFDFTPIDEEEESQILNTVYEILENGKKFPADPRIIQLLTLAGLKEVYKVTKITRNHLRSLQFGLISLSVIVFILCTAFMVTHPDILHLMFVP